jgi:biopolymer transport protein ExbD
MAFAVDSAQRSMASINITPLVDVMLVLLVIFMVTAPVLSRAIPLDLPQAVPDQPRPPPPEPIRLRIDAAGELSWNGDAISLVALPGLLEAEMQREMQRSPREQPMLQIDANADSDYGVVAAVLAAANNAGVHKVGFIRRE